MPRAAARNWQTNSAAGCRPCPICQNDPPRTKRTSGSKTGLERAALLWHGKSLWGRHCFATRIAAAEAEKAKKAQECRQLQDKLVGDQPLTPERREEIVNTMEGTGCTARLP